MEKTAFEIRESVKEHLDVLRLDRGYQCLIRGGVLHRKQDGRYRLKIGQVDLHLDDDALPIDFESAYRLLGLDKRDALEAHTRKEAEFEARMNLMDAKQEKYMDLYRTEKEKSKRWESRAWKILQIAKDKSMESFAHSIRVAKLEADLAAVGNTEQNTKLKWEQTFKANPWDGVSVCATYMGLDFHIELQDDGKFEMSAMLHGALYGFGKVAIRQRAINQMDKIFNEMLQDPIDVMRIAERYAKD